MRWGVLANLTVILAVSGLLLFVVFSASLQRAAVDSALYQTGAISELIEREIRTAETQNELWNRVRRLCREQSALKFLLYDNKGEILGGCGDQEGMQSPELLTPGRRVHVVRDRWPMTLLWETTVAVDVTGEFPFGVRSVRSFLKISPEVLSPSWKFFGAYLIFTQAALFFLGYLLFHRTVIGPIRDVAGIAAKAAGMADSPYVAGSLDIKDDIQKISSSLRAMMMKVVDDRDKMQALVKQLQAINRDLEAAQQGLIRSEKLAGVGRLAAGVAHEIGNPLQIVSGYLELLGRGPEQEDRSEILGRMDDELKRIHNILQKLLDFARPMREDVTLCNINEVVGDCGSLVEGRKGFRRVDFTLHLDPDLPVTETEPEKIRQIVVNLIFNAADAISESGGSIDLTTRRVGDAIEIEIRDTGTGIAQENLEKVYDPFFTTKEPGKGTGLGLAVCLGLVESLGGIIDIDSVLDEGTTVRVRIPVSQERESGDRSASGMSDESE
jgi:two-component system, NtrC family, sensor kinase